MPPHFSLADVRTIAPAALAPLGRDYVRAFGALLAQDGRRLDLADMLGHREAGGFSVSAPGTPAGLYIATFGGSLDDLRRVMHEGGHAIAAQVADDAGTPSLLAHGPNSLMESYALLDEFLLYDHLAQHARTPAERERYLVTLVDDMVFQVFGSAEEATLEQTIHDEAAAGRVQSAADLDRLTIGVRSAFEPWPADVLHASSSWWASKRLYYQDPFYLVNYLYAGVIAINLYAEAKAHPATFAPRYHALLARGYDAPTETLLAPMLGDGVTLDALTTRSFDVIRAELDRAEVVQTSRR
jgi:oligoendopeptidase F